MAKKTPTPPPQPDELPINDEHREAMQSELDKKRYAYVETLSPEDKERFKKMEEIVVQLKGANLPFILLACPERKKGFFWNYQAMTNEELPHSEKLEEEVKNLTFTAFMTHAQFSAKVFGHSMTVYSPSGFPFYHVTPKGVSPLVVPKS